MGVRACVYKSREVKNRRRVKDECTHGVGGQIGRAGARAAAGRTSRASARYPLCAN